jgi:hypothetical protein
MKIINDQMRLIIITMHYSGNIVLQAKSTSREIRQPGWNRIIKQGGKHEFRHLHLPF